MPAGPPRKWVYFLHDTQTHLIKIGWAHDPLSRLRHLQTGSPGKLILMGVIPGGEAVEASYHHAWRCCRVRGEWFTADTRFVGYIRRYARQWSERFLPPAPRNPVTPRPSLSPRRGVGGGGGIKRLA